MNPLLFIIGLIPCLLWSSLSQGQSLHWQTLAPQLEYTTLPLISHHSNGTLHVFRIDPTYYQLTLDEAKNHYLPTSTVYSLGKENNALMAINGGFFDREDKPLGLRISQGKVLNPLKNISWWGVFYMEKNTPHIASQKSFVQKSTINFAIQAGPRLVINGTIPTLKESYAARTLLGITKDNKIIVAVTHNALTTTQEIATLLAASSKKGGLDCKDALNLDGGSSTQLYAAIDPFYLHLPGFSSIPDVLLIHKKEGKEATEGTESHLLPSLTSSKNSPSMTHPKGTPIPIFQRLKNAIMRR